MKTIKKAVRALLLFMLILCNIGAYAQKKMEYNIGLLQEVLNWQVSTTFDNVMTIKEGRTNLHS